MTGMTDQADQLKLCEEVDKWKRKYESLLLSLDSVGNRRQKMIEWHPVDKDQCAGSDKKKQRCQAESMSVLDDDCLSAVLAYLPTRDKVQLESVNRQWKRCVFKSVTRLVIDSEEPSTKQADREEPFFVNDLCYLGWRQVHVERVMLWSVNVMPLKSLLNKCWQIRTVKLARVYVDQHLLRVIGDGCCYLEHIELVDCRFDSEHSVRNFFARHGARLSSYSLIDGIHFKPLKYLPKLNPPRKCRLLSRNVLFFEKHRDKILSLEVSGKRQTTGKVVEAVSKCFKLKHLKFNMPITEEFAEIVKNCPEMHSLNVSLFSCVLSQQQLFEFLLLISPTRLNHLTISVGFSTSQESKIFSRFDELLPNLRHLNIKFYNADCGVTSMIKSLLESLSRSKKLVRLAVHWTVRNETFPSHFFNPLISGNKCLRLVRFKTSLFSLSNEFLNALRDHPKVEFELNTATSGTTSVDYEFCNDWPCNFRIVNY